MGLKNLQSNLITGSEQATIADKQDMIIEQIGELGRTPIEDSAKSHSRLLSSTWKFHFTSKGVPLEGREYEMNLLKDFCGFDALMSKKSDVKPFEWWMITGEGGSGKSKLAFELAHKVETEGWTTCFPISMNRTELEKCSRKLPNNTLFVLDYSEYGIVEIMKWINSFNAVMYNDILVRVLLIQRKKQDVTLFLDSLVELRFVKENVYNDGNFMRLPSLASDGIKRIQLNFAKHKRLLSNHELDLLFSTLQRIDTLIRPLYAIIVTDAYLEKGDIVLNWSEKTDFLDYMYEREEMFIKASINEYCGNMSLIEKNRLKKCCLAAVSMATMTGGVKSNEELRELLPDEYGKTFEVYEQFAELSCQFIDESGIFVCAPCEPDIIGEYLVIKFLKNEVKNTEKIKTYTDSAWSKPYSMSRFVNRLCQDFSELLQTAEYQSYYVIINEVVLPDCVTEIPNNAFSNCPSLLSIEISASVKRIGKLAFSNCTGLLKVKILGEPLIETGAFWNCFKLREVFLGGSFSVTDERESMKDLIVSIEPEIFIADLTYYGVSILNEETNVFNAYIPDLTLYNEADTKFASLLISADLVSYYFELVKKHNTIIPEASTFRAISEKWIDYEIYAVTLKRSTAKIDYLDPFWGCLNLRDVVISTSVDRMPKDMFLGCPDCTVVSLLN